MITKKVARALTRAGLASTVVAGGSAVAAPLGRADSLTQQPGSILLPATDPGVGLYAEHFGVSVAEAQRRLAVQARAHDLVAALSKAQGSSYGGVWFDNATGRLNVGLPSSASDLATTTHQVLAARQLDSDTNLVTVRSTWDQLLQAQAQIQADPTVKALSGQGHVATGIDTAANTVDIAVQAGSLTATQASTVDALARTSAATVRVQSTTASLAPTPYIEANTCRSLFQSDEPPIDGPPNFLGCHNPLRGGNAIIQPAGPGPPIPACTVGVDVTSISDGLPYELTDGHCLNFFQAGPACDAADNNAIWTGLDYDNNRRPLGHAHSCFEDVRGDAGIIHVDPTSVWYQGDIVAWAPITYREFLWPFPGTSYQGLADCSQGMRDSQKACGTVVRMNVSVGDPANGGVGGLTKNSATAQVHGDSGAPWLDGYGVFYGLTWGGSAGVGTPIEYTEATAALGNLNVTLANTGCC